MLGTRYGFVPAAYVAPDEPAFDWLRAYPAQRSVTELEMHFAALGDPAAAADRCVFMLRDEALADSIPAEVCAACPPSVCVVFLYVIFGVGATCKHPDVPCAVMHVVHCLSCVPCR